MHIKNIIKKQICKRGRQLKNYDRTCDCILNILCAMAAKHKKMYCYPAQKTLLEQLKKRYKIGISRRTLNYKLALLERLNYFRRQQRFRHLPDGRIIQLSSLYFLMGKIANRIKGIFRFAKYLERGFMNLKKTALYTWKRPEEVSDKPIPKEKLREFAHRFRTEVLS